jgi:hypothetical protein
MTTTTAPWPPLLRSLAAVLAGETVELNRYSAQARALAAPHSWVGVWAQYMQAVYWASDDPPRSDRLFEEAFEIDAGLSMAPDPLAYSAYYLSRLRRANGRDEAVALLHHWRADLRDSIPTDAVAAAFALYGDTCTAVRLMARNEPASVPMEQFLNELAWAVLASAQGQFDQAEQRLATMTSVVRDHAIPGGEGGCLAGFAKVALDRGDYVRASRLLASVMASAGPERRPHGGTVLESLVHAHCSGVLQGVLDPETARITQAEGAALSLKEALDAELMRSGHLGLSTPFGAHEREPLR